MAQIVILVAIIAGMVGLVAWRWILVYNDFQYWITTAQCRLANVTTVMQQRIDNIHAITQVAKKYGLHEHKSLKDTIEARGSRGNADNSLGEDSGILKLRAVAEQYPNLKADEVYTSLMMRDSAIEEILRETRQRYNQTAQRYNEIIRIFPRNIVAHIHNLKRLDYISFAGQQTYEPKNIFGEE